MPIIIYNSKLSFENLVDKAVSKIPISDFLIQYIYFAGSIGNYRLSNLKPDFFGIMHEFKFIIIPFILIFIFYCFFIFNVNTFSKKRS